MWVHGADVSGMWVMALVSGVVGLLITVGLIVLIVLGIRWLLRQERAAGTSAGASAPRQDDPLEVLRRRYASGEIDDEEYERRRKILTG
jgi:putative membrane protein